MRGRIWRSNLIWAGAGCHKAESDRVRRILTILQVLVPKPDGAVDHATDQLGHRGWVCRVGCPVVTLSKLLASLMDIVVLLRARQAAEDDVYRIGVCQYGSRHVNFDSLVARLGIEDDQLLQDFA